MSTRENIRLIARTPLFAPQAQDLLEELAEILLDNFHREHILLKLKIKRNIAKI